MNYISNFLLLMMLLSYCIPIGYVYSNYHPEENNSVSSVIGSKQCQLYILVGMILMGIFTVLYELKRGCKLSLCSILVVLVGIYGVILIKENEKMHYVFGSLVFVGIICFMTIHCKDSKDSKDIDFLRLSLYLQFVFSIFLLVCFKKNIDIFFCEVLLIINFAVFYLFLHFF